MQTCKNKAGYCLLFNISNMIIGKFQWRIFFQSQVWVGSIFLLSLFILSFSPSGESDNVYLPDDLQLFSPGYSSKTWYDPCEGWLSS